VRVGPGPLEARVRGLQTHGVDAETAEAGARVAVALAGTGIAPEAIVRGDALVSDRRWEPSRMLTAKVRVLADPGWSIATGQRLRVHAGTAEVMARCTVLADLDGSPRDHLAPGDAGWIQLRLEGDVVARVGMRLVLRAYSPVTTIAGGTIVESHPPRRRGPADPELVRRLRDRIAADPGARVLAALEERAEAGLDPADAPIRTGLSPRRLEEVLGSDAFAGAARAPDGTVFAPSLTRRFGARVLEEVTAVHEREAFRPGLDVAKVRSLAPSQAHDAFADAVLAHEVARGRLETDAGTVHRPGFVPTLTDEQAGLKDRLAALYADAGFEAPSLDDLPSGLRGDPAFHTLLGMLEREGRLVALDDDIRIDAATVAEAIAGVRAEFSGRDDLGPADFRSVIPVSRRYLLPILAYLDRAGVTRFDGDRRRVVDS
ncbi:MAG TPA: SelB C-terminal domain-containing protein, partial [Longimicrobiales bacterium]|nr:SelB C-terminal domain-containing protein [Longimicrobiales bacterium]